MLNFSSRIVYIQLQKDLSDKIFLYILFTLLNTLRYGTTSAMIVHSSCVNRWFAPFFGTLALTGGQFFTEEWYPLASNGGLIIFIITLLLLMSEIDKDMVQSEELVDYLDQVAKKGDEISVRHILERHKHEAENIELCAKDSTDIENP